MPADERRIRLGALHPTRDFSYVSDTVAGFMAALRCARCVGEVINTGSGFEISIGETAQAIAAAMGVEVEIVTEEVRLRPQGSEVERLWAATDRARELLGWQPQYAGLEGLHRGLARTAAWFGEPANLQRYKPQLYNV